MSTKIDYDGSMGTLTIQQDDLVGVVEFKIKGNQVVVTELCDQWYGVSLDRVELGDLIDKLTMLRNNLPTPYVL